jgi:N-acetylglucosamine-6-phosphate deacetylase
MPLLLRDALVVLPERVQKLDVAVAGGVITAMGAGLEADGYDVLDASDLHAGPGFIDVHVHGGGGHSFFEGSPAAVEEYARWAPRHGVTSFLVSTAGATPTETAALLHGMAAGLRATGAEPLGFHLEGPFLNPARKGAFPGRFLRAPAIRELESYLEAARGRIRQVTLAPELPGALELVDILVSTSVVPAMGHTDATASEARAAFDRGVSHVTHLFNAMRPIHQREGGAAVAALLDSRVTCELICDFAHVSPEMLRLAATLLGRDRLVLVTDNLGIAGTTGAATIFAGAEVRQSGGAAIREDGTIVGSVTTFDAHFRNLVGILDGDLVAAFRAASANPARVAGAAQRKGSLEPGKDADLVLLDGGLAVVATICRGELCHARPGLAFTPLG